MDWLQISIETTQPDIIEDCLLELGAVAVMMADAADQPLLEPAPGETPVWDEVIVTGLFEGQTAPQPVIDALDATGLGKPCRVELMEDRDWVRAWMDRYEPIRFGEHLWVCPHHHEVNLPDAVVLKLDPGLAFGSGTHPTTALCLEWLDQANLTGKTVIDYGCGSGILALAAALLGAREVIAVDIDPQALTATADNARRNGVTERLRIGTPEIAHESQADIVLANILAGPLMTLAPQLIGSLRPGGQIVLAGLLDAQMSAVMEAYAGQVNWHAPATKAGWTRLNGGLPMTDRA